jgi:hypothetical protein
MFRKLLSPVFLRLPGISAGALLIISKWRIRPNIEADRCGWSRQGSAFTPRPRSCSKDGVLSGCGPHPDVAIFQGLRCAGDPGAIVDAVAILPISPNDASREHECRRESLG